MKSKIVLSISFLVIAGVGWASYNYQLALQSDSQIALVEIARSLELQNTKLLKRMEKLEEEVKLLPVRASGPGPSSTIKDSVSTSVFEMEDQIEQRPLNRFSQQQSTGSSTSDSSGYRFVDRFNREISTVNGSSESYALSKSLNTLGDGNASLESIECRETLCRMSYSIDDQRNIDDNEMLAELSRELGRSTVVHHGKPSGNRSVLYLEIE